METTVLKQANIQVYNLKTDNTINPLGISRMLPLFSWKLDALFFE